MLGTILLAATTAAAAPPAGPDAAPPPAARERAADPEDAAPSPQQQRIFNARLARHKNYENCVRTIALELAGQRADPGSLAKAAVVLCQKEELDLWLAALSQCRSIGEGEDGDACADRFMAKWIVHAEREALRCIAAKRYRPAALAKLCRRSEVEEAEGE